MKNKILGDKKKSSFDDNLANIVNELAEKGELNKQSEKVETPALEISPVDLSKIEFELKIPITTYRFDESLADLKSGSNKLGLFVRDYDRHPRPREIFEYLRCVNPKFLDRHDLIDSATEWTSCAFKKEGSKLSVALDPENLVSDNADSSYVINGPVIVCSEVRVFDVGSKPLRKPIGLEKFPKELLDYLYGFKRPCSILKNCPPTLQFVEEGIWLPVARIGYDLFQDFDAKSRGVKIGK